MGVFLYRLNTKEKVINNTILEFYHDHKREEMFIRHLKKLYELHMECENWAEAAFTLEKQSKMLRWTEEILSQKLEHKK